MFASGTKAVAAGGLEWTSSGDVAAVHYQHTDFTWDQTWRELDLSSKLAEGTKLAKLRVTIQHSSAGPDLRFRKLGYSNIIHIVKCRVIVANQAHEYSFWMEVDADRKVGYKATTTPGTCTVTVLGSLG